jgi:sensor histidine kinase YesM
MKSLKKYEHSYLLLSSVLITIIINLPFFVGFFSDNNGPKNFKFDRDLWFNRTIWYTVHGWVSLIIFSYFNYFWKYFIIPRKWKKIYRISLVAVYNIVLAYILLKLTVWIAGMTVGNIFGPEKAFTFYLWKYFYILPLAVFVAYVLHLITRTKIIEIENARLREENMESQLNSLKEQINPHFLFNTLNTLSSVIRLESKKEGLDFVDKLSSVYRYILESNKADLLMVEEEIRFINSYLFMLKKRYENKLKIILDLPEKVMQTKIPPMTLQLLIENAIKHNKILKTNPLRINIFYQKGSIHVENNVIENNEYSNSFGLGLQNLKERYRLITGEEVVIQKENEKFIVKLPIIKS